MSDRRAERSENFEPPREGDPTGERTVEPVVERGGEPSVSLTDDQTGLLDRPGFIRYADMAMQDHGKAGQNVAVIVVDAVPKTGISAAAPGVSPAILVTLVDLIRDCFRPGDVIARWGDATFVALIAGEEMNPDVLRSSIALRIVGGASSVQLLSGLDIAVGVGSSATIAHATLDSLIRAALAEVGEDRRRRLGWA